MAAARPKRPTQELVAASEHLLYEVKCFFDDWALLSARWSQLETLGVSFQEAVGVAFLVHGRALANVYFPHQPRIDDVIAADFFLSPSEWVPREFASIDETMAIRRWVGRDVAHISYRRISKGEDRRDYELIYRAIRNATVAFVDAAPADHVLPNFLRAARSAAISGDSRAA
jgi:hypothetical protein